MARYSFVMCRSSGEPVGEALAAKSRQLTRALNQPATATLTLQLGDALAPLLAPGTGRLKVYRAATPQEAAVGLSRVLVFYGSLPSTNVTMDGQSDTVTAQFADPRWVLARRFSTGTEWFTATNQGAIIHGLLAAQEARAEGATWMIAGSVSSAVKRDRTFARQQVSQLVDDLTKVVDGCDVDCGPYDGYTISGSRTMGSLNTYDRQGTDKPNVIFAYGPGTIANVQGCSVSYAELTTRAEVTGSDLNGAAVSGVYSTALAAGVGMLEDLTADPDLSVQATVDAKARGVVTERGALRPIVTISDPLPGAPRAIVDYNIGDTVRVQIKRGALAYSGSPRVMAFSMDLDAEGFEKVSVTFA